MRRDSKLAETGANGAAITPRPLLQDQRAPLGGVGEGKAAGTRRLAALLCAQRKHASKTTFDTF